MHIRRRQDTPTTEMSSCFVLHFGMFIECGEHQSNGAQIHIDVFYTIAFSKKQTATSKSNKSSTTNTM
jgi:hypothetical protein